MNAEDFKNQFIFEMNNKKFKASAALAHLKALYMKSQAGELSKKNYTIAYKVYDSMVQSDEIDVTTYAPYDLYRHDIEDKFRNEN